MVNNVSRSIFGWFSTPQQKVPEYDPGLDINCPFCHKSLRQGKQALVTLSFMGGRSPRSYFYRVHRDCRGLNSWKREQEIESTIIDKRDV